MAPGTSKVPAGYAPPLFERFEHSRRLVGGLTKIRHLPFEYPAPSPSVRHILDSYVADLPLTQARVLAGPLSTEDRFAALVRNHAIPTTCPC